MLSEQARICRRTVISLVPNAASLPYRIGKALKEGRGTWEYGLEMPLYTQREDFSAVGLESISEQTIGARHALGFLEPSDQLYRPLQRYLNAISEQELCDYWQGYLLATVGIKP